MAAPAILFFVVTCIAGIRGGNNGGNYLVRGSSADEGEGDSKNSDNISTGDDELSLEYHHGHHKKSGRPQDNAEADSSFDFYAYSMSYQPEFCKENNEKFVGCQNPNESWEGQLTIHGLWPNRDDGTWPSTCSNEKLDISLLQDLSADLAQRWPNVKASSTSPGHEAFWAHEWSKHGTCSGLSQQDYFMTALDLLLKTPIIVKENYGSVVKREDLEKGYLGSDMSVFVCKHGYLSEVRVCFEKMADGAPGERVTCPQSILKEDSCGDEIKIASFDSSVTTAIK